MAKRVLPSREAKETAFELLHRVTRETAHVDAHVLVPAGDCSDIESELEDEQGRKCRATYCTPDSHSIWKLVSNLRRNIAWS